MASPYQAICKHVKHQWPLKVARGHATYIDGKMLSVTENSFHINFQYSARAMTQAQIRDSCAGRMADIHSAVFVFNEDLACQMEIKDFLDTEGILLPQRI